MSAKPKGKVATKGAKQIVEDNVETIKFYRNMIGGAVAFTVVLNVVLYEFAWFNVIMSALSFGLLGAAFFFMNFMSRPKFGERGELLDSGSDLNMEGGTSDHVKDFIILISGTLLLTSLTNWFWLLLLLIPGRVFYALWGSIVKPWLFGSGEPEDPALDEKRQRKNERKMKKMR